MPTDEMPKKQAMPEALQSEKNSEKADADVHTNGKQANSSASTDTKNTDEPEDGKKRPAETTEASNTNSPEEDLLRLNGINWKQAVILRLHLGVHPDPNIEALLKRRLDIPRQKFLGPIVVRVLCTLAFVVVSMAVSWLIFWGIFSLIGLREYVNTLSGLMVTLLAALLGVAAFQPFDIYDEIGAVNEAEKLLNELRRQVEAERKLKKK